MRAAAKLARAWTLAAASSKSEERAQSSSPRPRGSAKTTPQPQEDAGHHFNHDKLSNRILLALALGAVTGLLLNATIADQAFVQDWVINGLFRVVGQMFVHGLTMLVVPIVFVSLVAGVSSLGDPARLGRIGAMAIGLYLVTTAVAVLLAVSAAILF